MDTEVYAILQLLGKLIEVSYYDERVLDDPEAESVIRLVSYLLVRQEVIPMSLAECEATLAAALANGAHCRAIEVHVRTNLAYQDRNIQAGIGTLLGNLYAAQIEALAASETVVSESL